MTFNKGDTVAIKKLDVLFKEHISIDYDCMANENGIMCNFSHGDISYVYFSRIKLAFFVKKKCVFPKRVLLTEKKIKSFKLFESSKRINT